MTIDLSDDAIDALLRDQFAGPVPADGFTEQVMASLPPRRRRRAWPLATGIAAGTALCGLALGAAPIARAGLRDWLSGSPSAPAVTLVLAIASFAALALVWILMEADDRRSEPLRPRAR